MAYKLEKLRLIGEAIIFRHTIFSLPIAAVAILLESGGYPEIRKVILILIAATAGRNAWPSSLVMDKDIEELVKKRWTEYGL